jgi:two-component system alkaline phosphatase synthesis response regulator PhoP
MSKRILIADDEAFIRILLRQTMESLVDAGVELLSTGNGQEAWELIQSERPDLVILDVMMPGLSGHEICQRIKSEPRLSDIHVMMLTARGQQADRLRSIETGANEYVTKPFDPDDLVQRAAAALDMTV